MSDAGTLAPSGGASGTDTDPSTPANKYGNNSLKLNFDAEPGELNDWLRAALVLGAGALFHEANKPGLFRGISPADLQALSNGQGLTPVAGSKPKPAASAAEMTYRHTRPSGNARIAGTNRISWTTQLADAVKAAEAHGTKVVAVDRAALQRLGVQLKDAEQLLKELATWEKELSKQLSSAVGKNKMDRLQRSIAALKEARRYILKYKEHHTVGPVPKGAINPSIVRQIRMARSFGAIMIGLSIFLGAKAVYDAEPDRKMAVLCDEVASFSLSLILPTAGPIGRYASQTARGELHVLSMVFPTMYTWVLDAYIGETLEAADPEGASYIRRAMQTQEGQLDLIYRMFGGY